MKLEDEFGFDRCSRRERSPRPHWHRFLTRGMVLAFAVVTLFVQGIGCGGKPFERPTGPKVERQNDLKILGLAYHNYCDGDNELKSPAGVQDLKTQVWPDQEAKAIQGIKDGQYILIWNVPVRKLLREGSLEKCVLGYEKGVPTSGGWVLMGDGHVVEMSAEEFRQAPKCK